MLAKSIDKPSVHQLSPCPKPSSTRVWKHPFTSPKEAGAERQRQHLWQVVVAGAVQAGGVPALSGKPPNLLGQKTHKPAQLQKGRFLANKIMKPGGPTGFWASHPRPNHCQLLKREHLCGRKTAPVAPDHAFELKSAAFQATLVTSLF